MSFDLEYAAHLKRTKSQSLWNRAMSFDSFRPRKKSIMLVSIPLEQGNVFRLILVLINAYGLEGLNPFGTGQCLSTKENLA